MDSKKVFVIYGRNNELRESMFSFLQSLGLHPLEWEEIVSSTGKSSPYVGEVLEKGFEISQCAIALFTPDDESRLREELRNDEEPDWESELSFQPRQNVIFEAGMAMGKYPDRTIIIEIGKLRPYSDVAGRHVIKMDNSAKKRNSIASRLENAGCSINRTGDMWLSVGNFSLSSLPQPEIKEIEKPMTDKIPSLSTTNKNYKGASGGIQSLIDDDFFSEPKTLVDVFGELKNKGYHYPKPTISKMLSVDFSKKRKILIRLRDGPNNQYVIRK